MSSPISPSRPVGPDDWSVDLLGDRFRRRTLPLGPDPDGEGEVCATLVRPTAGAEARRPAAALLFVHGMSDYFFHDHLAAELGDRGVRCYGLDLRKCGRSRQPGQTPHYVSDLALYDADLDAALDVVAAELPGVPVVVAGHSTGGLVVSLWLARRRDAGRLDPVRALVLDGPWLQLDVPDRIRPAADALLAVLSRTHPRRRLPLPTSDAYGASTHSSRDGDFDYDLDLKPFGGVGVRPGWLAAVRRGQRALQAGLELPVPVLLLRSATSTASGAGSDTGSDAGPDTDRDLVLDVEAMRRYGPSVGSDLTDVPLVGARHDVFLSRPEVRGEAVRVLGDWLGDRVLAERT